MNIQAKAIKTVFINYHVRLSDSDVRRILISTSLKFSSVSLTAAAIALTQSLWSPQ